MGNWIVHTDKLSGRSKRAMHRSSAEKSLGSPHTYQDWLCARILTLTGHRSVAVRRYDIPCSYPNICVQLCSSRVVSFTMSRLESANVFGSSGSNGLGMEDARGCSQAPICARGGCFFLFLHCLSGVHISHRIRCSHRWQGMTLMRLPSVKLRFLA